MSGADVCRNSSIAFYGEHKSGTTWLSIVATAIAKIGCIKQQERIGNCTFERQTLAAVGSSDAMAFDVMKDQAGRRTILDIEGKLYTTSKHSLPLINMSRSQVTETAFSCRPARYVPIWEQGCLQRFEVFRMVRPPCPMQRVVAILRNPIACAVSFCTWATSCSAGRNPYAWGSSNGSNTLDRLTASDEYELAKNLHISATATTVRYVVHAHLLPKWHVPSLLIFYEDMVREPLPEYYRLAAFIGVTPPLHLMKEVVANTSGKAMREEEQAWRHNKSGAERPKMHAFSNGIDMVQSASADSWRARISPEALTKCEAIVRRYLHPYLQERWLDASSALLSAPAAPPASSSPFGFERYLSG